MPAPAAVHSPAQMRRIAWSLLMAQLKEMDEGELPPGESAVLAGQVQTPLDTAMLSWTLLDLAVMLWTGWHPSLAAARAAAAAVALDLAAAEQ